MDHSRTSSADSALTTSSSVSTVSSASSCIRLLENVGAQPGAAQEMPLRTMYTLNCSPRTHPSHVGCASSDFSSTLMAQISQLPAQPASLPPSFVTSFLLRVFSRQLDRIDFCQALTGLDYLKDLEGRRRREVASAFSRLSINRHMLALTPANLAGQHPRLAGWISRLEQSEQTTDSLYTSLYLGIRQWIMINEMSLTPFNKNNCHAMLNTLFPPVIGRSSNTQVAQDVLQAQRATFFRYIKAVEVQGACVLDPLVRSSVEDPNTTGWSAVRDVLEQYLDNANTMIRESQSIVAGSETSSTVASLPGSPSTSVFSPASSIVPTPQTLSSLSSPVPVASESTDRLSLTGFADGTARPETASSRGSTATSDTRRNSGSTSNNHGRGISFGSARSSSPRQQSAPVSSPTRSGKNTPVLRHKPTALGRLAREFRRITSSARRLEVDEIISQPCSPAPTVIVFPDGDKGASMPVPPPSSGGRSGGFKGMSLRKMRSFGGLTELRQSAGGVAASEPFDGPGMQKQRLLWERRAGASTLAPPSPIR